MACATPGKIIPMIKMTGIATIQKTIFSIVRLLEPIGIPFVCMHTPRCLPKATACVRKRRPPCAFFRGDWYAQGKYAQRTPQMHAVVPACAISHIRTITSLSKEMRGNYTTFAPEQTSRLIRYYAGELGSVTEKTNVSLKRPWPP